MKRESKEAKALDTVSAAVANESIEHFKTPTMVSGALVLEEMTKTAIFQRQTKLTLPSPTGFSI